MKAKLLLLLLSFGLPALAQSHTDAESKILMENAWNLAQRDHDAKALEALVADTFVNTDYDGTVENKSEFLTDSKDTSYKYDSVGNTNVSVFFYNGTTAVVTGTYHT